MPWNTPVSPVSGTVITVAFATSNIVEPITWLRLMTGNSDPPGSNYVVVSTGPNGTSWQKVPSDALAAGVAVANLGYTPADRAGDNFTGTVSVPALLVGVAGLDSDGPVTGSSFIGGSVVEGAPSVRGLFVGVDGIDCDGPIVGTTITATAYHGGSDSAGTPSVLGLTVGGNGIASSGAISAPSATIAGTLAADALTASGAVTPGHYAGGSTSTGTPSVLGLSVGTSGISSAGPISPSSYLGGSTGAGVPSFLGISVGASGIAAGGAIVVTGAGITASGTIAGGAVTATGAVTAGSYVGGSTSAGSPSVLGLSVGANGIASAGTIAVGGNAVWHAGNFDPTTKSDVGHSHGAGGATVPSGLIAAFETLAELTAAGAGWARYTAADGRLLIGAGTTGTQTFTEATSYGSSWAHSHSQPAHNHGASALGISGSTGAPSATNGLATAGGVDLATVDHTHDEGTLDVTGNTDNASPTTDATTWLPYVRCVIHARKT